VDGREDIRPQADISRPTARRAALGPRCPATGTKSAR